MSELKWWQRGVIYQIYPRSYQDSNGDGVGDLRGITARLDYLATLGIEAVWLSPIFTSPMKDFGYDVADYCNVDPLFGTLDDFDDLVRAAHDRGLKVMLDFVPNHSSDEHPWFLESRSSRTSARRDWYIWRDPAPDGGPPNNWKSFFGGDAWTYDDTTGQYYLHQFLTGQPELNWANPDVRRAMSDVLRFWMRRGVDGFRVDVIWLLAKDPTFANEPLNPDWQPGQLDHGQLVHTGTQDLPLTHAYIRELRAALDEFEDRMMVGEIYLPIERLVTYYGSGEGAECHLPFNFHLINTPWTAGAVRRLVDEYDAAVSAVGGWPNWVLGNHDQHRFRSRVGDAQYRVAQTLLLTLRGTPTVYYGDEIGMRDVPVPLEQQRDPQGLQQPDVPGASRDPERTPMQWDDQPNAGFSSAQPWLPVAEDAPIVNVAAQAQAEGSDLQYFRALTRLRAQRPALHAGTYRPVDTPFEDVFAYLREHEGDRVLVLLNFGGARRTLDLGALGTARTLLSSDAATDVTLADLELRPHEARVLDLA
ncbi:alpha-amylase family glycosyl hydrolase [Deinococcus maricopensis]|uniref:Alpha amylase catalytic region n=1 Tax=Deinococcus maricopensis (strain DSM 21211 / LMG 22137 / NRRL B-23946 / LB-34) TaxID=709986 RepID=E8UBL8_DEIML|nr:alpha-amylase family glycosyl hydrolase [Deinococcus maricopensis]ADV68457.1 alpha amylase catalytic region [Deinococcus maricopensis DSM 21211]